MGWPTSPEYNTSFYQMSRHAEIVVTRDRDCFAFFPDMIPLAATPMAGIWRDSAKTLSQWTSASGVVSASERTLLWARVSGDGLVSGFRCVPYVTSDDIDDTDIAPFREVYAPRVVYDRESNSLHLWFWTNVNWAYNGTAYDEAEIYKIGAKDYDQAIGTGFKKCKKVLCYAVGHFEHLYVEGGWVGSFVGQPGSTAQYDMIPIFSRPKIITNYAPTPDDSANGPGLITDGWYAAVDKFPFQLVRVSSDTIGMRCGYRIRGGIFCESLKGAYGGALSPSHDLNDLWTYQFGGAGTIYIRLRHKAVAAGSYDSPEIYMATTLEVSPEASAPPWGNDYFHRDLCVGKVDYDGTTLTYEQWWHGGNEDDISVVPDANTTAKSLIPPETDDPANPTRKTLEFYNLVPAGGNHQRELQMYDVHTVPIDVDAFSYFETLGTDSVPSGQRQGTLKWAILDSQNKRSSTPPSYRSLGLDFADPLGSGKQILEVYGFHAATAWKAPYCEITGGARALTWQVPVQYNSTASGGPVYFYDSITGVSVNPKTANAGATIPSIDGKYASVGSIMVTFTTGSRSSITVSQGTGNIAVPGAGTVMNNLEMPLYINAVPDHKHLHKTLTYTPSSPSDDANKATNEDHDHRYIRQGDPAAQAFLASLGYKAGGPPGYLTGGSLRVELNTCQLFYDGTNWTVDWKVCQLKGNATASPKVWDVLTGTIFRVQDSTVITYGNAATGALQVTGGTSIAGVLQITDATDINSGAASGAFYCMGGATITKKLQILDITDGGDFTGSTGALQVRGGASIAKQVYIGTNLIIYGSLATNHWTPELPAGGGAQGLHAEVLSAIWLIAGEDILIRSSKRVDIEGISSGIVPALTVLADSITILSSLSGVSTLKGTNWTASPTTFNMNPTNMQYASQPAVDGVHVRLQPAGGGAPFNAWIRKGGITST